MRETRRRNKFSVFICLCSVVYDRLTRKALRCVRAAHKSVTVDVLRAAAQSKRIHCVPRTHRHTAPPGTMGRGRRPPPLHSLRALARDGGGASGALACIARQLAN